MLIHHKERLSNEPGKETVNDFQDLEKSFKNFKH